MHRASFMTLAALVLVSFTLADAQAQATDSMELNSAAVEWIGLLRDQRFDSAAARVDPAVVAQLGSAQLREVWTGVGAQLGALESLEHGSVTQAQGYHVVDLIGTFANGTFTVRVAFDAQRRVSGLFFLPRTDAPT